MPKRVKEQGESRESEGAGRAREQGERRRSEGAGREEGERELA